jgi:hypothetical protein
MIRNKGIFTLTAASAFASSLLVTKAESIRVLTVPARTETITGSSAFRNSVFKKPVFLSMI